MSVRGINEVTVGGELVRDPLYGPGKNGRAWSVFTLKVNRRAHQNEDGTYNQGADYIECEAYSKNADRIHKFHKGDRVVFHGSLRNDNREKDGVKTYSYKVTVEDLVQTIHRHKDAAEAEHYDEEPEHTEDYIDDEPVTPEDVPEDLGTVDVQ